MQKIKPFVVTSAERFQTIEHLAENRITTGVLIDPLLPYITDTKDNVQGLVKKAKYIYLATQVTMADCQ